MTRTPTRAAAAALLAVLVAGCGGSDATTDGPEVAGTTSEAASTSSPPAASPTDTAGGDLEGTWVLEGGSIDGEEVSVSGEPPTLTVGDGTVGGTDTCNTFGADVELADDGTVVSMGQVNTTMRACEDNPYDDFATAIAEAKSFVVTDDRLVVTGTRGTELTFTRT